MDNLNLSLRPFNLKVIGDGNCLMRAFALATGDYAVKNPYNWTKRALELRRESIDFVRSQIEMGQVDFEHLNEFYPDILNWNEEYTKLRMPGIYQSDAGDTMPQVMSSYTGIPIIIINLNTNHTEFILPELVFFGKKTRKVAIVLVRLNDHYDALQVPNNQEETVCNILSGVRAERLLSLQMSVMRK